MARALRFSALAEQDLTTLRELVRVNAGPDAADRATLRILRRIDALKLFPEMGRVDVTLNGAPRCSAVPPWSIVYDYDRALDVVFIWRVIDGRRDLASLIRKPHR